MLCSVIIPLYNKEAFIEAAVQSVLNQQYQNFEVIVVDDGSTDNGFFRVGAIQDQRIHIIQQANAGVSCARNRGIEQAKGELICFLDADDWYHPMYLETVVLMATRYPEIYFFAANYSLLKLNNSEGQLIEESFDGRSECITNFQVIDNLFNHWLRLGAFFFTSSVSVRRKFLLFFQPCFPPGESMAEDQDLWFRLAERTSMAYCQTPLVVYRHTEGSLCATHRVLKLLPVFSRLEQRVQQGQMPSKLRASALRVVADARVATARNLLLDGRRYEACRELLTGLSGGIISRRWWISLLMCAIFTPSLVKRWEHWRDPRRRD